MAENTTTHYLNIAEHGSNQLGKKSKTPNQTHYLNIAEHGSNQLGKKSKRESFKEKVVKTGKKFSKTMLNAAKKYEKFLNNRRSSMKNVTGRKWRALTRKQCTENNIKNSYCMKTKNNKTRTTFTKQKLSNNNKEIMRRLIKGKVVSYKPPNKHNNNEEENEEGEVTIH